MRLGLTVALAAFCVITVVAITGWLIDRSANRK
jgi:hypothetical protein